MMTDGTPRPAPALSEEQALVIAEAGSHPARRARRHPAGGSRVAAAGIGVTAMLGLMAGMGAVSPEAKTTNPVPALAAAPQHVVVVHRASQEKAGPDHAPSAGPIALTARRVVHTVTGAAGGSAPASMSSGPAVRAYSAPPSASTPTATTSGSQ
jgi:hypothetical protein